MAEKTFEKRLLGAIKWVMAFSERIIVSGK
jgi:hypothetical protein